MKKTNFPINAVNDKIVTKKITKKVKTKGESNSSLHVVTDEFNIDYLEVVSKGDKVDEDFTIGDILITNKNEISYKYLFEDEYYLIIDKSEVRGYVDKNDLDILRNEVV